MFALQYLIDRMTEILEQHGQSVNRTRLNEHFPDLTEKKGILDRVFIICSKAARKVISDATQSPDEKARTLLMAPSILRNAVLVYDTAFPNGCKESSLPQRIQYLFRQFLAGPKSSPK